MDRLLRTARSFIIVTLLLLPPGVDAHAAQGKSVWILHSYHQGWPWTDHITQGIGSVFEPFGKEFRLYYDYLDLHRAGDDALDDAADYFRKKLTRLPIDVIVASDDGALRFLEAYGEQLAPGAPVVFCGINTALRRTLPGGHKATGVVEQIDHLGTFKLMSRLHPDSRRIIALVDDKNLSPSTLAQLEKAAADVRPRVSVDVWQDVDWAQMPARLVGLTSGDLVYLLAFDHDRSGNAAEAAEVAALAVRWSRVPVYTPLDLYLGSGVVGGVINSGRHQGSQAGRMALRILSGEGVGTIPVTTEASNPFIFDGRVLQRFGIDVGRLPENRVLITNPQPVFWQSHGIIFISLGVALLVLCGVLLLLLLHERRKQSNLVQINADLDGRIREKSVHLRIVNQKLKKQSLTDGITGIPNRRYIYQRLVEEIKKARRYGLPLTLVFLDIDGLKQIYDQHGYVLGERILRDAGRTIKRNIREIDLVGRYGGEAFMVILPNTVLDQGRISAERVKKKIALLSWEKGEVTVTLSGGLVQFKDQTPPEMVQRADDLLNHAKRAGGNRIADSKDANGQGRGVIPWPESNR